MSCSSQESKLLLRDIRPIRKIRPWTDVVICATIKSVFSNKDMTVQSDAMQFLIEKKRYSRNELFFAFWCFLNLLYRNYTIMFQKSYTCYCFHGNQLNTSVATERDCCWGRETDVCSDLEPFVSLFRRKKQILSFFFPSISQYVKH